MYNQKYNKNKFIKRMTRIDLQLKYLYNNNINKMLEIKKLVNHIKIKLFVNK